MLEINFFDMVLKIDKNFSIISLRGYLGNKFKEFILLHHHKEKNKFLYKYPLIQYKKINNNYHIIGLDKGAEVLKKICLSINELSIKNEEINVDEKFIKYSKKIISETDEFIKYKFLIPWIALNQKNYEEFKLMTIKERKTKLEKILIGNILSMCKTLNYTVKNKLVCKVDLNTTLVKLKGLSMNAFKGSFKINFLLPDYIGIGKSVSRGFGTIKQIN